LGDIRAVGRFDQVAAPIVLVMHRSAVNIWSSAL
jgi:hypothetical protein